MIEKEGRNGIPPPISRTSLPLFLSPPVSAEEKIHCHLSARIYLSLSLTNTETKMLLSPVAVFSCPFTSIYPSLSLSVSLAHQNASICSLLPLLQCHLNESTDRQQKLKCTSEAGGGRENREKWQEESGMRERERDMAYSPLKPLSEKTGERRGDRELIPPRLPKSGDTQPGDTSFSS